MELAKWNRVLFGIVFSLFSLGFLIFLVSYILTNQIDMPWYGSISIIIMVLAFVEAGLYVTKTGIGISEKAIKTDYVAAWSDIANVFLLMGAGGIIIVGLVSFAFLALMIYLSITNVVQHSLQAGFFGYFIIVFILAYLLFRSFIWNAVAPIFKSVAKAHKSILPSYVVYKDQIMIDPAIHGFKKKITVKFSELSQVREMSFFEAEAYKDKIGPNVPLGLEQTKSLYKLAKTGERPKVYFMVQSSGKTVLLKGNNIHYLITFNVDSAKDLITAFKKYKKEI